MSQSVVESGKPEKESKTPYPKGVRFILANVFFDRLGSGGNMGASLVFFLSNLAEIFKIHSNPRAFPQPEARLRLGHVNRFVPLERSYLALFYDSL